ncbi:ribbon-helix-helix domain-containing protein [Hoeflea sp. EC-HK425]|uniref:ribbon-helix-helix domain-containing protein n=1 Tax=Hoeflea sp. EC-HK425 TaxID=2038388 RepID=UPI001257BC1D|nr:ribbon-helix-helix domain-containing protein [Hoeflea sp. EC-HK425]VVS99857.1 conserved hypothetical protein [Hoeflea sp. EC-HK425]
MSKRKPIDFSALSDAAATPTNPIRKLEASAQGKAPARMGKVQISAFVEPEVRNELKALAALNGRSLNDLLEEAFQMVRDRYKN